MPTRCFRSLSVSIAHPEAEGDRLVLCRSGKRRDKEQAMLSNAEKRFLAEAGKLRQRVTLGRLRDKDKILKAIGSVLAKHPRVARFHQLDFAGADMTVQRKASAIEEAYELCGDYVLRTDQAFPADGPPRPDELGYNNRDCQPAPFRL